MNDKLKDTDIDRLFDGILALETREECYAFFEDLCTVSEILDMSRRLKAADMLMKQNSYNEIRLKTNLSTATISRVNRSLKYGNDGYVLILNKLSAENDKESADHRDV